MKNFLATFLTILIGFMVYSQDKKVKNNEGSMSDNERITVLKKSLNDISNQIKTIQNKQTAFIRENTKKIDSLLKDVKASKDIVAKATGEISNSNSIQIETNQMLFSKFNFIYTSIQKRSNFIFTLLILSFISIISLLLYFNNKIKNTKNDLDKRISEINETVIKEIESLKITLSNKAEDIKQESISQINKTNSNLDISIREIKNLVNNKVQDLKIETDQNINTTKDNMLVDINKIVEKHDNDLTLIKKELNKDIENLGYNLKKEISDTKSSLQKLIEDEIKKIQKA